MHEKSKLKEARYFFSRMIETKGEIDNFVCNLSAFLSASRSILQYALEESKVKPGGQKWYDDNISNSSILKFFKDKRDINIHKEPVRPKAIHKIMATETIHFSDSISITIKDTEGNVEGKYTSPKEPKTISNKKKSFVISETEYRFNDWIDNKDVMALSKLYLEQLENLINVGVKQGFISG